MHKTYISCIVEEKYDRPREVKTALSDIGCKSFFLSKDEFLEWDNDPAYHVLWVGQCGEFGFGFTEDGNYVDSRRNEWF